METLDVLKKARALLGEGPHRWTKGSLARTADGELCYPEDAGATCFCAMGAMAFVTGTSWRGGADGYVEARDVVERVVDGSIARFNDTHTYEEVLALFDKAIEAAS
jgi:hypothetical protein